MMKCIFAHVMHAKFSLTHGLAGSHSQWKGENLFVTHNQMLDSRLHSKHLIPRCININLEKIFFFKHYYQVSWTTHGSYTWRCISGFKGQWIKQVKLPFVPFPLWIRSHPVICSINGRKVDALQLTGFNVYFRVQCGVKMWIDLVCWVSCKKPIL